MPILAHQPDSSNTNGSDAPRPAAYRTYKYRLYPTKEQAERLDFLLWQARKIYNGALAMRIEAFQERGEMISAYDLRDYWCAQRKVEPETYGELPYDTVDDLIRRLDKAYKAFFRRIKEGKQEAGFPRFKGRRHFNSIGYANGKGMKFVPRDEKWAILRLINVGNVRVRYHRPLPDGATIKYALIKRSKIDKWYVALQLTYEQGAAPEHAGAAVGIDVGLHHLLALSDGTIIDNPRWLRDELMQKRRLNRKLSRQKKGSGRWYDTVKAIATLDGRIAERRSYFWHTVTDMLTKRYSLIAIEDLTLDFMIKNRHLALSASDAALGTFREYLTYKCEERGVTLIAVPPAYTSQICSGCGEVAKKKLSERTHRCGSCGLELDRDVNAAINILNIATKTAVQAVQDVTQASGSYVSCERPKTSPVATGIAQ